MLGLLEGLLQNIPVWGWIALAGLVGGGVWRYVRVVGWQGALASVVAVGVLAAHSLGRKQGWEAREKEGSNNVKRVMEQARKARERVRVDNADPDRLRDDDGYRRD